MENDLESCVGIIHKDCRTFEPIETFGMAFLSMNQLIEQATSSQIDILRKASQQENPFSYDLKDVTLQAPIPNLKQDIICLGANYKAHAQEANKFKKGSFDFDNKAPVYFSKRVNKAIGDGDIIPSYKNIVDSLDYEVELAVIIGKDAKNVPLEEVEDYIFGYTIINDITGRNIQMKHNQWYFGKSLDGFTPMGPVIVTTDEIEFPPKRKIQCYVNDELKQNSNTDDLIFGIDYVIHELSQGMTLKAGTIISTGTPEGVGMGQNPPKFLKSKDVVTCKIEGIGTLTNIVE
jgi:2-keto-4-pentenoate hydratase/2-oxohepta-3-ene-1,7-dioic acid hydratase in catechol pathway